MTELSFEDKKIGREKKANLELVLHELKID